MKSKLIILILGLTFLVYIPALFHQFINLDDPNRITNNPQVQSLSAENVKHIFTTVVQNSYTPLTILSFALEFHLVQLNPFLYHLNNILMHLGVVLLVYRLGLALGLDEKRASVASFIFALHPMHVESVAWVSERKDVLYSIFYLGAVLSYLNFLKTQRKGPYVGSILLGFLSMLAKPMAVSLPLILLACDWFTQGKLTKKNWLTKIPYGLAIVPLSWFTYSQSAELLGQNLNANPLFRFWAAAFYFKKFFWPLELVVHYVPPVPVSLFNFEYASAIILLGVIIVMFWRIPNQWLRFALLWFILSIFFLLNFDYPRFMQTVADRYMYLPSVGICFLLGHQSIQLWEQYKRTKWRKTFLVLMVGIAFFLTIKTHLQVKIWRDSFTLWDYTVKHSPRSFWALSYRGRIFYNRGQDELALADFEESIRINPYYAKVYLNLGQLYERQGNMEGALENYAKAAALSPKYKELLNLHFQRLDEGP